MANQDPEKKSTKAGTKEGEERATFIIKTELIDKVKDMAYWDRILIKEVIESALTEYLKKYEKKNGEIKPRPAGK